MDYLKKGYGIVINLNDKYITTLNISYRLYSPFHPHLLQLVFLPLQLVLVINCDLRFVRQQVLELHILLPQLLVTAIRGRSSQ